MRKKGKRFSKTSLEVDTAKIAAAKQYGFTTLKDLVDKALDAYLKEQRRNSLGHMLGTDFFSGDYKAMRKRNGSPRR